jgi:hypothetical protein
MAELLEVLVTLVVALEELVLVLVDNLVVLETPQINKVLVAVEVAVLVSATGLLHTGQQKFSPVMAMVVLVVLGPMVVSTSTSNSLKGLKC